MLAYKNNKALFNFTAQAGSILEKLQILCCQISMTTHQPVDNDECHMFVIISTVVAPLPRDGGTPIRIIDIIASGCLDPFRLWILFLFTPQSRLVFVA